MKPQVLIVMGSDSDLPVMEGAEEILKMFHISYEITVASAHRTPERAIRIASGAEKKGVDVIIAGAGMAAHLAGVLAAHTILPVIGVPIDASSLKGMDSLLSTVQMPPGIPVATMAIGKAGAKNAAILSAQIIARKNADTAKKLREHKKQMAEDVEKKATTLKNRSSRR
ncbi:MAG: 5-(carboxyamino)imidazole ribonucleotide mutase [Nitrospirota bacterium]